eukprot:TRINITY_DN18008_c0_g1_i3.p1 TRINITY_DN18008_c0_g1~~TRINITY_DN18008_c0_g1_i3.p1  ORF type:complete len:387 (+),score=58.18 TRINITY_DN18008_c0_g1_i3:111-1163(+)
MENRSRGTSPKPSMQAGTVVQTQEKQKKLNLLNIYELSQMSLADAQHRLRDSLMLFNRRRLVRSTSTTPDDWYTANDVAWKPQAPVSFMPSLKIPPLPQQQGVTQRPLLRAVDSQSPVMVSARASAQLQQLEVPLSAKSSSVFSPRAPIADAADVQDFAESVMLQGDSSREQSRDRSSLVAGPSEQVSSKAKELLQYMEGFDTFALDRLLSSRPGTGARSHLSTPRTSRRATQSSRPHLPSVFPKLPSESTSVQAQQVPASAPAEAKAPPLAEGLLPKIVESTKPDRSQQEKPRKHGLGLQREDNWQLTSQAIDWSRYLEQRIGGHMRATMPTRDRQRLNRAREQQRLLR